MVRILIPDNCSLITVQKFEFILQFSQLSNEIEFEGGAFLGPGLFFKESDAFGEFVALGFEGDLLVKCAGGVEGNGEYVADEVLPHLREVETVNGNGEAGGIDPVGFVEFVV